jgi:hypothetical protein
VTKHVPYWDENQALFFLAVNIGEIQLQLAGAANITRLFRVLRNIFLIATAVAISFPYRPSAGHGRGAVPQTQASAILWLKNRHFFNTFHPDVKFLDALFSPCDSAAYGV